jgi:C4-dicarboxylate transporter DctM subunit
MPILIPVLKPLGIDPVHFAIVVTINMELALITAPVGLNLYVMSTISKRPLGEVIRGVNPFVVLMFILLMLVTYAPAISLWLPKLVYG